MTTTGYRDVAAAYLDAGYAPLPLPPRSKTPPPDGTTGADGRWPTPEEIETWREAYPANANVALRLPTNVIGIDVDDYDGKNGAATLATLEAELGPLPPTVRSTSRGVDNPSGIRLYRIPDGIRFPGVLGPGVDVIQNHHRYVVASPSIHPDTGERYRFYDADAVRLSKPPYVSGIAELPTLWVERLAIDPNGPVRLKEPPSIGGHASVPKLDDDDSIAEHVNRIHDWHNTLVSDGWTLTRNTGAESHWARPGKNAGTSAVLHEPDGPLNVFTTSAPTLQHAWALSSNQTCWSYSMFGYLAATRFAGDRSEIARRYRLDRNEYESQIRTFNTSAEAKAAIDGDVLLDDDQLGERAHFINWVDFWAREHQDETWIAYPLIPAGRSLALYAPAKAGKSTVVLALVVDLVTGGYPYDAGVRAEPVDVLYLDFEMTEDDLNDRLSEMGCGPDTDLSKLHYALLPSLPPLDDQKGADAILRLVEATNAKLVVIDTFGRAVEGDEDRSDTVRAFYRLTGQALKRRGCAVLRTDHSGKDVAKGQRGSSAKADDVDIVWQLKKTDGGLTLTRTHSRISWGPQSLVIRRTETDGVIRYQLDPTSLTGYADGTSRIVKALDQLGAPNDTPIRTAKTLLKDSGVTFTVAAVKDAVRCRKARLLGEIELPPESCDAASVTDILDEQRDVTDDQTVTNVNPQVHVTSHATSHASHDSVATTSRRRSLKSVTREPDKTPDPNDLF